MKKVLVFLILTFAILMCLSACNEQTEHIHEFEEWSITKYATCTEDGIKTRYCSCGEKQSDTIPATGHDYFDSFNGTCSVCGMNNGCDEPSDDNNSGENENLDIEIILHTKNGDYNVSKDGRPILGYESILGNVFWEPGNTRTFYLSIKNNSSFDLNYSVALEATNIVNNINEVIIYIITPDATLDNPVSYKNIDWSVGNHVVSGINVATQEITLMSGAEYFFALSVHMDELAGNSYMGGDITFNIKVIEGKLSSENDLK